MAQNSEIEWTEATWNPVTGCTKISLGCKHCYAERMAKRLAAMGVPQYRRGFEVSVQPSALSLPAKWKKPRVIFVNSMSDLFHEDVPFEFIRKVFAVMEETPWHTYQVLTKRPEVARQYVDQLAWPANVWLGTSVEHALYLHRVRTLTRIPAQTRFLSLEPLLGGLSGLDLRGIDWVIVGGESGPGARVMKPEWVAQIRDICLAQGVPFFFKQWGGVNKKKNGRLLDGRTWDEVPTARGLRKSVHVSVAATGG